MCHGTSYYVPCRRAEGPEAVLCSTCTDVDLNREPVRMRTHTFFGLCDELQARNREAGLGRWGGGEPATGIRLVRQEPSILIGVVCDLTCLDFRQNTHKIRQARFGRVGKMATW